MQIICQQMQIWEQDSMVGTIEQIIQYLFKQDKTKKYEVKEVKKKRSTNANNYFWRLLQELCEVQNLDTIEEYKKRVKELGIFRRFRIEPKDVKTFEIMWQDKGIAWFCEIADTEYIGNVEFKIIHAYYGSSSFNSKQMSRLIDNLVQDCQAIGIETKNRAEIDSLLKEWDK